MKESEFVSTMKAVIDEVVIPIIEEKVKREVEDRLYYVLRYKMEEETADILNKSIRDAIAKYYFEVEVKQRVEAS